MTSLFETDDALWPEDLAYSDVFTGYEGGIHPLKLVHLPPAVICSPRKTGKTTQLRRIYKLQKQFKDNIDGISIIIPSCEGGFPEQNLRDLLMKELKATEAGSLLGIIESSKKIKEEGGEKILAVVDADNLHEDALRWLLYGVRSIGEEVSVGVKCKVQVIIDGSFSVDTMTSGPDSEFPMPQLYPREFSESEQRHFVHSRLESLRLRVQEDVYKTLWKLTLGDKYFTQALCKRIVKRARLHPDGLFSLDEFNECLNFYIYKDRTDQLKAALLQSIKSMSETWATSDVMMRNVLEHISSKWEVIPKNIRALTYKGGLIRRTGFHGVQLRAPIVLAIYNEVESRVQQVKALLNSSFDIEGVPEDLVETAKAIWDEILVAAYNNSLKALHVGFGRKVTDAEIKVRAVALHHGQYEGTIEVRTDDSVKPDDELWFLLWTYEDVTGGVLSKLRTLPIKPVITNNQNLGTERLF
jgi:hypothetical protein